MQGSTAIRAGQLISFHGDPADRMIVATAIENSATLITADEKIEPQQNAAGGLDVSGIVEALEQSVAKSLGVEEILAEDQSVENYVVFRQ